jgi:hypothetical protein
MWLICCLWLPWLPHSGRGASDTLLPTYAHSPNYYWMEYELSVVCSGLRCVPSFTETRSAVRELKVAAGLSVEYFVHPYMH